MESLSTQKFDAAMYASSTNKQIDNKLDRLAQITLPNCRGEFHAYIDKQTAVMEELSSMSLQPDQWKNAVFRHGLPYHLRITAWAHAPPRGVSDPVLIKLDLIDSLVAAQTRFEESQRALAISPSSGTQSNRNADKDNEAIAESPETSEGQTGDPLNQAEDDDDGIAEPSRTSKRQRDDPRRQAEEDKDAIVEPSRTTKRQRGDPSQEDETADSAGTQKKQTSTVAKRRKNANVTGTIHRVNMKKLAQPEDPSSVSVKPKPSSDVKKVNLYSLGPLMTAYSVFQYLETSATNVPRNGPLAMNVATLPRQKLMTKIINETVISYARSRMNQLLTDAPLESSSEQQETITPVDLDQDLLKEPTDITQATTLQQSLARLSELWKQRRSMVVHQKMLESWAINVVYNAAGLQLGEKPDRSATIKIKRAAQDLMPVMRPGHTQGGGDQTILRTQYCWKLLAEFRFNGIPFIVAYRPSTVDTILLADGANRLKGEDIPAWVPTVHIVEHHINGWFDALEGGKGRSDMQHLIKSIVAPSRWASPFDQSAWNSLRHQAAPNSKLLVPGSAVGLATYGYNGLISRRKCWSVMELPGTQTSIAISNIPEAYFLGVVPGILRRSATFGEGCIPGPDEVWLDTRQSHGSLSKIALGSEEETNTVLAWHFAGDDTFPSFQTAWVLAFSSRPIEIFQELVRWDGVVRLVEEEQV